MWHAAIFALVAIQHGHDIKFVVQKEGSISYRVWGNVFRQYAGGKTAPRLRSADVNGVFRISYKRTPDGFDATGVWDALKLSDKSKALPENERKRAKFGKWIGPFPNGPLALLINGQPGRPDFYSALGWPVLWAPLKQGLSMRIDEDTIREVSFPVSTFLEDDPIGDVTLPVRLIFEGPAREGEQRYYRFRFDTEFLKTISANHPEQRDLTLSFSAHIGGSLLLRREDGSIETAAMFASYRMELLKPNNEIPFSSANGSVSCNWQRLPSEPSR